MTDEKIRQRIRYLVEHGGVYPKQRPTWLPWALGLLAVEVVTLGVLVMS